MRKSLLSCLATCFCMGALAQPSVAAIVYVDATSGVGGNTTLADGSIFSPPLNGTTGADNNWEQRTTFGTGGNIFESSGEVATEDAPELRTRISGLVANQQYSVFAYFFDPASAAEDWNIRAGFTSNAGANSIFTAADAVAEFSAPNTATPAVLASTQTFASVTPVFVDGGTRNLLAASLGTIAANASGEIDVYIDDFGNAGTVNRRTWFDGVGYEPVAVPEPASISLLGLGLGLVAARRRKRS